MLRASVISLTHSNRMNLKNKRCQMSYIITIFGPSSHSGVYNSWTSKLSILSIKFRKSMKKHIRAMFCMIWYALGLWLKIRKIIVGSMKKKFIIFWKTIWFSESSHRFHRNNCVGYHNILYIQIGFLNVIHTCFFSQTQRKMLSPCRNWK